MARFLLITVAACLVAASAVDSASIGEQEPRGFLQSLFGRPCKNPGWTVNGNEECLCTRRGFLFLNFEFTNCRPVRPTTTTQSPTTETPTEAEPEEGTTESAPEEGTTQSAPEEGTTQSAPEEGTTQSAPEEGTTQSAPEEGTTEVAPEEGTSKSAPEEGTDAPTPVVEE